MILRPWTEFPGRPREHETRRKGESDPRHDGRVSQHSRPVATEESAVS
jgi:hypothetical protein